MRCRRCNDGRYIWRVPSTGDMSSVPCPDCNPHCRGCGEVFVPAKGRIFYCAECYKLGVKKLAKTSLGKLAAKLI